jgi:hypothetical protein
VNHIVSGVSYHDCDDDGETAAGGRLGEILRIMGVSGVAVIVSRWFGGTLLGARREKRDCLFLPGESSVIFNPPFVLLLHLLLISNGPMALTISILSFPTNLSQTLFLLPSPLLPFTALPHRTG